MIDLQNITYVNIDGRQSDYPRFYHYTEFGHLKWPILYAEYAKKYFNFGKFLIITPDAHKYQHDFIEFKHTVCFGYKGYSQFVVNTLKDYIDTEYCLIYQPDGAICNPELWDDEFLEYDYMGAPWGFNAPISNWCRYKCLVGNGGFSLRSKRFLEVSSKIGFCIGPEDQFLLCKSLGFLISNGIKIPECNFARKFSVEYPLDKDHREEFTFGFHKAKYADLSFLNSYREKVLKELNLCQ